MQNHQSRDSRGAQQQSPKLTRDEYFDALRAEFEISAQTACAAQAAKQYVKPAAAELTQLMGSAEFENKRFYCIGAFPALLGEGNFI